MIIKKINLLNFRNYHKVSINFDKRINIIIGDNAQGKTNILESIYFLALTKSYRTIDMNLINHEFDFTRVKGEVKEDKLSKNLEVFINKDEKKVFINSNEISRLYNKYECNISISRRYKYITR